MQDTKRNTNKENTKKKPLNNFFFFFLLLLFDKLIESNRLNWYENYFQLKLSSLIWLHEFLPHSVCLLFIILKRILHLFEQKFFSGFLSFHFLLFSLVTNSFYFSYNLYDLFYFAIFFWIFDLSFIFHLLFRIMS